MSLYELIAYFREREKNKAVISLIKGSFSPSLV